MIFSDSTQNMQIKFDTGPLSWVMPETRAALMNAKRALHDVSEQGQESQSTLLKHAKTYLHQVHGALQMIDINGVVKLTDLIETLLDRMANGQLAIEVKHIVPIELALDAIQAYLDGLLVSAVQQPVRLFSYYRNLLFIQGADKANPADLFSPDLIPVSTVTLVGDDANKFARTQPVNYAHTRKRFELELLSFLKQTDEKLLHDSVKKMQALLAEIWCAQTHAHACSFWAVMYGFAELTADQKLFGEQHVKQLFGRINLQIRCLAEGAFSIPESLMRDALFLIARAEQLPPNAANVYKAYQLEGQVPANFETQQFDSIEAGVLPICKEHLGKIKTLWGKIAGGERGVFEQFEQKMQDLADISIKLKSPPLTKLVREMTDLSRRAMQKKLVDAFSLEMAAGLLFLENSFDQILHLPTDFSERAEILASRLLSLINGESSEQSAPWLDEMSQKVQQRQTMAALVGEMQSSLRVVEKTLDEYFRDPADASNLDQIDPIMHQIAGALAILDQEEAIRALSHTQNLIRQMAQSAEAAEAAESVNPAHSVLHTKIAQNIGAMSFLIEALQAQPETVKDQFSFNSETGYFKAHFLEIATPIQPLQDLAEQQQQSVALVAPTPAVPDNHLAGSIDTEMGERSEDLVREAKIIAFPSDTGYCPAFEEHVKKIGHIEIDVPLYNIYLAETDEIVRFLSQDFSEWRHESHRPATRDAVHAVHSLAGSSATVGFASLQKIAHALEMVLQRLEHHPVPLLAGEFDTLDRCIACIKKMLLQFALAEMPSDKPEQILVLEQLLGILTDRAQPPEVADFSDEPAVMSAEVPIVQTKNAEVKLNVSTLPEDDTDPDLLLIFLEEGNDLLPLIGQTLRAWQDSLQGSLQDSEIVQSLLRLLHTVKGSARMAGAMALGQHIHDMESQLEAFLQAGIVPVTAIDSLLSRHDTAMAMFDQLRNPGAMMVSDAEPELPIEVPVSVPDTADMGTNKPIETSPLVLPDVARTRPVANIPLVRIRADILDRLVNQAGEVSISRSRLENEVATLRASLLELNENVGRLRDQLREVEIQAETQISSRMAISGEGEFDPLEFDRFTRLQELTRMMAESVSDISTLQVSITKTVEGAADDLNSQARLTRELQQDLMRVRMVPFASISERLYRITRQTSRELGKRVNLDIRGASVEIDRSVLEKMVGPFEHLLRNAIFHGIETREKRLASGKNEMGEISVQIRQEGNEVVINFNDDGQGLNLARIREKARQTGLLAPDEELTDAEASELIFESGFSTAQDITELAGRGIGMDVVRSEAASLGGRVSVSSTPNIGSNFTIHLPLTLAVTQVVLLSCGGKTYAVPSVLVEQVQQLKAPALAAAYTEGAIVWQGQRVPMHYLSTILADHRVLPVSQQYTPVIIMRSGSDRVALHVDQVIGNREVVVKNIGQQLSRMVGISGATVLGSGDIVLILNPLPLVQKMEHDMLRAPRLLQEDSEHLQISKQGQDLRKTAPARRKAADSTVVRQGAATRLGQFCVSPEGLRRHQIVMVVDDSLTVRKVSQRLLLREGYQVVLAKDGVDALQQLQAITPDVMLVDIEMPRMDGFDLTRNVRNDERLSHIPIIMITSRIADKHRSYAQELGVNAYFGKPFQEEVLLDAILEFLPHT